MEYWNENVDQIQAWHDEWQEIVDAVPSGEFEVAYDVEAVSGRLDTSLGLHNGADIDLRWDFIGLNIDTINRWNYDHCLS